MARADPKPLNNLPNMTSFKEPPRGSASAYTTSPAIWHNVAQIKGPWYNQLVQYEYISVETKAATEFMPMIRPASDSSPPISVAYEPHPGATT
jgi:hypothetical protein